MEKIRYFEYGDEELAYLKAKDPILGKAIDQIGHIDRAITPDLFMALIKSMIGQQISTKAQEAIWRRFGEMFAPVTPENIASLPAATLQTCGISTKKAEYIKEIAQSILDGRLDLQALQTLPDAAVCERLSQIRGVGVWTAEMLMIFSMQRKDVLSWGDLAILRGLRMLYRHRKITPQLFKKYKNRYSPYASVASLYLWQISHGDCAGLVDLAPKPKAQKRAAAKKDRG